MRTRPWPLVLLALVQLLTPVVNVLFNAWVLRVSPLQILTWLLQRPWIDIFEALLLMPIAGIAIFRMRRWSYAVFFVAMVWSIYGSVKHWQYASSTLSAPLLILLYVLEIALVIYFLTPEVRTTYFDPRVRWWESKPRYELKVPGEIRSQSQKYDASILNVSEGGAFLSTSQKLEVGKPLELHFSILSQPFSVTGKLVHTRDLGNGVSCYGMQFIHSAESAKKFRGLTRGLEEIGFQERSGRKPMYQEFFDWLRTLLTTGRGWRPDVKRK